MHNLDKFVRGRGCARLLRAVVLGALLVVAQVLGARVLGAATGADRDDVVPTPTNTTELIAQSVRAEAAGDLDQALSAAKFAVALAVDIKDERAAHTRWIEVRKAVAAPEPDPTEALATSAKVLFAVASACESRKLYANAADVLNLLEGTAYDREARGKLAKLFSKPQAIEGLLESGIPVEVQKREQLSRKEIARLDALHADFTNPLVLEGQNYVIKTDMGYEMARAMLDAMEQINKFYRVVFKIGRGKKVGTCTIYVYKDRAEFEQYAEPGGEGVQGYYNRAVNEVHTYDHGSEDWLGREFLWSTLFHEASHQFTAEIWKLLIPTWLNEGTGSYFEGAVLQAGGFVATNRIAEGRLSELISHIGTGTEGGESAVDANESGPSLKEVLSYMRPGSYPGEYYPFGWGLVYFCRNYEDAQSRRVFLPVYEEFMRSYTQGNGTRHPFTRFEEYFIRDAKVPGIDTFAAFEQTWKGWIRALHKIHSGGPEQAEVLLARGRKQLADGAPPEYAVDSFRWATEKDPLHATAWLELGRASRNSKSDDAALYAFRRLASLAQRQVDATTPLRSFNGTAAMAWSTALSEIKGIDAGIERLLRENLEKIVSSTMVAVDNHVELGFPISALSLLRDADLLIDGDGRLRARIRELAATTGVDGRLARNMLFDADLEGWTTESERWKPRDAGHLGLAQGRGKAQIRIEETPPKTYRIEALIEDADGLVGLLFDGQQLDESYFLVQPGRRMMVVRFDSDPAARLEGRPPFSTLASFADKIPTKETKSFRIAIEVEHTFTRFFIDGEEVGRLELPCEEFAGQVGLVVLGQGAVFSDVRLSY